MNRELSGVEQNAHAVGAVVDSGNIRPAVVVKVRDDQLPRTSADAELSGLLERTVAISQQHSHIVLGAGLDNASQIQLAVAIEVCTDNPANKTAGGITLRVRQSSLSVAQKHTNDLGIANGYVQVAIS